MMDDIFTEACRRLIEQTNGNRVSPVHGESTVAVDDIPSAPATTPADAYVHYLRTVWQHILKEAAAENRPVYLYGAGEHSRWLLTITEDLPIPQLRGFVDDKPAASTWMKFPVYHTETVEIEKDAIVVLSSDRFEQVLYERARHRFGEDITIIRFYENLPPGPYPRPKSRAQIQRQLEATHRARARWGGGDFVGPYEQAGYVTGFLQEQWLWSRREQIRGQVLDMSTPKYWHQWMYELSTVERVSISDYDRDIIQKDGYTSKVDLKGDFCAASPPTSASSFDTVLCLSILEHCDDPARMIKNLHTLLIPGGNLLLTVPFAYVDGHCRPDYWRFGREGLQLLAGRAGFTRIETGGLGDLGPFLGDVLGFDLQACNQHDGVPLINWLSAERPPPG